MNDWENLKESRKERKRLSDKDRSKFKKTDLDKQKRREEEEWKKIEKSSLPRGRVLSMTSQGAIVEHDHETILCSIRGVLKKEKTKYKTIVTVGDFVRYEKVSENEGVVVAVEPRNSYLVRADARWGRKQQILAANIDQVLITVSVVNPPLRPAIIDRYILATRKGHMEPVIVVNKIDLLDGDRALFEMCQAAYEKSHIPFIGVSAQTGEGLDALKELMKDKASVFSGQSGTGKTSLINAMTGLGLKVGDVVERTQKGSHTTSRAHLVPLECGGWCIDTPGIKSFGFWELSPEEVERYFTEIHEVGQKCHFRNCLHRTEEGCHVKEAVEKGTLSEMRYQSYLSLLESIDQEQLPR